MLYYEKHFSKDMSITMKYCLLRVSTSVQENLKKKNKYNLCSKLKFEAIKDYDQNILNLKQKFNTIIELYSRFYDILNDTIPDIPKLNKTCYELIFEKNKVIDTYENI